MNEKNSNVKSKPFSIFDFLYKYGTILTVILVVIYFSVTVENWATFSNVTNIFRSVAIVSLIALAITFSLAVNGFDLSAAAIASFAAVISAKIMIMWDASPVLAIIVPIIVGGLIGLINAGFIIKIGISDMLTTLSMMFIITGVSTTFQGGSAIYNYMPLLEGGTAPGLMPEGFKFIGQGRFLSIPVPVYIMLIITICVHIFLNRTKYGRYLHMIGGNEEAARLCGIPTKKYRTLAYVLSGVIASIAGVILCARLGSGEVNSAGAYLMDAVAAAFIGFSVLGIGKANAFGTLLGALLVGTLVNGLVMMSFPYYAQDIVKGIVLILGLGLTYYKKRG